MSITTTILTSMGSGFDTYGRYSNLSGHGSEVTMHYENINTYQPVIKFDLSGMGSVTVLAVTFRVYSDGGYLGDVRLDKINDAFYNSYVESSNYNWSDHTPTVTNIGTITPGSAVNWKEWTSAAFPGLITTVQGWIDSPVSNNGFLIATMANPSVGYFRTKENGIGAYAPQLIIEFEALETGKIQTVLAATGESDALVLAETGKPQTLLAAIGEADTQSMIETAKTQMLTAIIAESEVITRIETGLLLLMKAWIVSRFPWAFSEVDIKTATFSERRNINT